MKSFVRFILGTAVLLLVAYLLIYLGSTWRISNHRLDDFVGGFNVINLASQFSHILGFGFDLNPSKIVHKSELDGFDALANAFSLYVSCFTVIPFYFLVLLLALIYAVFTGEFVGIIASLVIGALMLLVIPFYPVLMWLVMLFQEGTSNYYVLWLLLGLPAIALGYASIAAPYYVIVVIIPIK